ncbi:MAG: MMPL family transporter [Phycisphaeraceae bacterium]|nr:MMPL family transporter [Phycisphaeraceae bacterium]
MHEKLRNRLLSGFASLVSRHPIWTLFLAGVLTVFSLVVPLKGLRFGSWTIARPLGFQSDRNDLIAKDLPWNQRFIDWQTHFVGKDQLLIAIDLGVERGQQGYDDRLTSARQAADALAAAMTQPAPDQPPHAKTPTPYAKRVIWRIDAERASPRGIRMLPMPEFQATLHRYREGLAQAEPLLKQPTLSGFLQAVAGTMATHQAAGRQAAGPDMHALAANIDRFAAIVEAMGDTLGSSTTAPTSPLVAQLGAHLPEDQRWQYLTSTNGRMLFLRVDPYRDESDLSAASWAIAGLRQAIAKVSGEYPDLSIGLTGIEVLETEETAAATWDSTLATIISFVLIAALLIIAYHSWRMPLFAMAGLTVAIIWTFGFATVAVGHLQVISVVFATILLGLGVAYGLHLAAHFELVRHKYAPGEAGFEPALRENFRTVGPGVFTGAITTAAAFCTTWLTDFTGVAEMGVIAAAVIMLCLLAMFSVYPALVRIVKPRADQIVPLEGRYLHLFEERWVMPCIRRPRLTLAVTGLLTLLAILPVVTGRLGFDYNLLKLLPANAPSVIWQEKVAQEGGAALYFAASIAKDLDQARDLSRRYLALPSVRELGGVGMLFPADEPAKLDLLAEARKQLNGMLANPPATSPSDASLDVGPPLAAMRQQLALVRGLGAIPAALKLSIDRVGEALDKTLATLNSLSEPRRSEQLAALQSSYAKGRSAVIERLEQVVDLSPLRDTDLPSELRSLFVDPRGRMVVEAHPRIPPGVESVLDPAVLPGFIRDVYSVDPNATGAAVQIYESGRLIRSAYRTAGILAFIAVFLLVALDFYSLKDAALSLVPVGVGFILTFGIMWLAGVHFNAANIMCLPLMFGIGVDSGVHMLHRHRQDPHTRPLGLTHGTGKGVTITSLTATIGFGSLMIAQHRGVASLGFVMATGILMTMLACWFVMPAWLEFRNRKS